MSAQVTTKIRLSRSPNYVEPGEKVPFTDPGQRPRAPPDRRRDRRLFSITDKTTGTAVKKVLRCYRISIGLRRSVGLSRPGRDFPAAQRPRTAPLSVSPASRSAFTQFTGGSERRRASQGA